VNAGLILAAGAGVRFGSRPKQLAPFRGRPLLEHAIAAQCAVAGLERVMVVLGSRAQEVLAGVSLLRAEPLVCADWEQGQAASLRCGATALAGAEKVIVTLGDQPLITAGVIERFLGEPAGSRAVYRGRPGHPVVLGAEELAAIEALTGDRGAGGLLGGPEIECSGLGSDADVDTPEDLEALANEARAVV
jgi:CTP:molybdopterin cytidylyltransferase MocA